MKPILNEAEKFFSIKSTNSIKNRRLSSGRSTKPRQNFSPEPTTSNYIQQAKKSNSSQQIEDSLNAYVDYIPMSRMDLLEILVQLPIQTFRLPKKYLNNLMDCFESNLSESLNSRRSINDDNTSINNNQLNSIKTNKEIDEKKTIYNNELFKDDNDVIFFY